METGNEIRFSFNRVLHIDSKERNNAFYPNPNMFNGPYNINFQDLSYFSVEAFKFSNFINVINANNNTILVDGVTYTIPVGNYTAAALISEINSLLTVPNIILTQSSLTGIVSISDEFSFPIVFGPNKDILPYILGFPIGTVFSGATSFVGSMPLNLQYTRYVDFCSMILMEMNTSEVLKQNRTQVYQRVHLPLGSYGESIGFGGQYDYNVNALKKFSFMQSKQVGYVDFFVLDEWGLPAPLNADWECDIILFSSQKMMESFSYKKSM